MGTLEVACRHWQYAEPLRKKATRKCPSISDLHVCRAEWTACRYLPSSPCHQVTMPGTFFWVANGRCK